MKREDGKAFLVALVLFMVVGLPVFYSFFKKFPPLSNAEVREYKYIASEVYYNPNYVVPEEYKLDRNETSITVNPGADQWKRGAIKCKAENGTLIYNYDKQTDDVIMAAAIVTGFLCVAILAIYIIVYDIIIAIYKVRSKKYPPA